MGCGRQIAQLGNEKSERLRGISGELTRTDFWRGKDEKSSNGGDTAMDSPHGYVCIGTKLVEQGRFTTLVINAVFRPNLQVWHQEQQVT